MASASDVPLEPPQRLARTLAAWSGDEGGRWLAALPAMVREYLERWRLAPERVAQPGGNISMVVLVTSAEGSPAALKLGMVTPETREEHAALAHWAGHGAARLLAADPERGVLLLEGLHPQVSLRSLAEPKAMLESCEVVRRLWVPPATGHPFTSVVERTGDLAGTLRERRDLPWAAGLHPVIDQALDVHRRLTGDDAPGAVLLHGDLHHGNILAADRVPWLAIDPKPLVGDPAYDLAWLVRDRLRTLVAAPSAQSAARRRLARLADALDIDRDRLRDWTVFRSVEAGVWSLSVGDRTYGELLLEFATWL